MQLRARHAIVGGILALYGLGSVHLAVEGFSLGLVSGLAQGAIGCDTWTACRDAAQAAETAGDFERFHDLAWGAMQKRGRLDADIMLLLARAQALSGRPHDSLVMLRRVAELGVAPTAARTDPAFERMRRLAGWAELAGLIEQVASGASVKTAPAPTASAKADAATKPSPKSASAVSPAENDARKPKVSASAVPAPKPVPPPPTVPASTPPATRPAVAPPTSTTPRTASKEAIRFHLPGLVPAGLAYDAASGRFLLGNRVARTVVTISERLQAAVDLVRSPSAGFHDVRAIAIDARRGDLWVASSGEGGASGGEAPVAAIHKLQLVSGRPLATIPVEAEQDAPHFSALAVDPRGTVFALDRSGSRLWRLAPGGTQAKVAARFEETDPSAMTLDGTGARVYVAHAGGVLRVSMVDGRARSVAMPGGGVVAGIESLGWHRGSLIAVERAADAPRRLLRLRLNPSGTTITRTDTLDPDIPTCRGPGIVTVAGDDVYYLAGEMGEAAADECTVVVRHLTLGSG